MSNFPRVIQEKPDGIVGILSTPSASVVLYTVAGTGPNVEAGLYMHGPFDHPAPDPTPPGN
jgi:hypothetical protein